MRKFSVKRTAEIAALMQVGSSGQDPDPVAAIESALMRWGDRDELLGKSVTLLDAYPHDSAYSDQPYVYAVLRDDTGPFTFIIGHTAARQALALKAGGQLPSKRVLTKLDQRYYWRKVDQ